MGALAAHQAVGGPGRLQLLVAAWTEHHHLLPVGQPELKPDFFAQTNTVGQLCGLSATCAPALHGFASSAL